MKLKYALKPVTTSLQQNKLIIINKGCMNVITSTQGLQRKFLPIKLYHFKAKDQTEHKPHTNQNMGWT